MRDDAETRETDAYLVPGAVPPWMFIIATGGFVMTAVVVLALAML
jgi:hypothetical protein